MRNDPTVEGSRLIANITSGWAQFALGVAVSLFLTPFVIQRTGLAGYGVYLLVESILGYSAYLYLGLGSSISRYAAHFRATKDQTSLQRLGGTVVLIYLGCGALVVALSWALAPWVPRLFHLAPQFADDAVFLTRMAGLSIGVSFPASAFSGLLRGHERIAPLNMIKIVELAMRLALIGAFLGPEGALRTLALIGLVLSLYSALARMVLSVWILGSIPDPRKFSGATLRKIAGFSVFSFLGNVADRILFKTDNIVIGAFLSAASITAFAVPARLVEYGRQLILRFREALEPVFARLLAAQESRRIQRLLCDGARWAELLILPIVSGLIFGGATFVELWIGEPFAEASWILAFLTIALAARAPALVCEAALWGAGRVGRIASVTVAEATLNLALSIWWIHPFGIVGVAAGTMVPSLLSSLLVLPALACRATSLELSRFLASAWLRPLAAGVPMVLLHAALRPTGEPQWIDLIWRIGSGIALYVPLAWWWGLTDEDRRRVRRWIGRRQGR